MCWKSHKYRASKTFLKAAPQMWFPWRNGITLVYEEYRDFLGSSVVKNLPANAGDIRDMGLIPAWGRSPWGGHDNPPQYSCLENPVNRGAWWATVHGVTKSQTQLQQLSMYTCPLPINHKFPDSSELFHWGGGHCQPPGQHTSAGLLHQPLSGLLFWPQRRGSGGHGPLFLRMA